MFLIGCAPGPSAEPEPSPAAASAAATVEPSLTAAPTEVTVEPSAMPVPSTGITVRWEQAADPWSSGDQRFESIVRGEDAWVAVTYCRSGECGGDVLTWKSSDGETWSATALARAAGASPRFNHLAVGAGGYLLTTDDFAADFESPSQLWASADGRAWQVIGEVPSTACIRRSCPIPRSLALAPSGTMLTHSVENLGSSDQESFGPYASEDGVHWRLIGPGAFGLDSLFVDSIQSTKAAVLLVGRSCRDCEPRIWTSTDGTTWEPFKNVPVQPYTTPLLATGAGQSVVVLQVCPGYPLCSTEVWSSADGGRWNRRMSHPELWGTQVTFTGSAFVAVGIHWDCVRTYDEEPFCDEDLHIPRYVVMASADGVTWGDVLSDSPMKPSDEDCEPFWIAGRDGTVLLGSQCGLEWRGTVTVPSE
jgi:hypothetical protein